MRADLHVHSANSLNSISRPESIMKSAAERGIDIIAITDSGNTDSWEEFLRLQQHFSVKVVLGQEIRVFNDRGYAGEVLCLFIEKPITRQKLPEIITQVKSQDGLVVISHPFSDLLGEFRAFDQIDDWDRVAIEVMNGRVFNKIDNKMAKKMAKQMNAYICAGSDAHTPFEVGNVYLEFDGKTIVDLKNAILNHQVHAHGKPSKMIYSLFSEFGRIGLEV